MKTRIKICGITRLADAEASVLLGADMLGFNFYPQSPRYVDPKLARSIQADLPRAAVSVGVFVNESADAIRRIREEASLSVVQLHGGNEAALCEQLEFPIIRCFRVGSEEDLAGIEDCRTWGALIDSRTKLYGGSGVKVDWDLAALAMRRICQRQAGRDRKDDEGGSRPAGMAGLLDRYHDRLSRDGDMLSGSGCLRFLLAGGLDPESVAEAVGKVRPWAVDVASGVEKEPGIKDPDKIKRFIEAVRDVT